jgi:hypothetical protein
MITKNKNKKCNRTIELRCDGVGREWRPVAFLEHDHEDVVAQMALSLDLCALSIRFHHIPSASVYHQRAERTGTNLLGVAWCEGQEGGHVKHDLAPVPLCVHRMSARAATCADELWEKAHGFAQRLKAVGLSWLRTIYIKACPILLPPIQFNPIPQKVQELFKRLAPVFCAATTTTETRQPPDSPARAHAALLNRCVPLQNISSSWD